MALRKTCDLKGHKWDVSGISDEGYYIHVCSRCGFLERPRTADADARSEEGSCQKCGERNPVWWAAHPAWNLAVGGDATREAGGILCPTCFHQKWLRATRSKREEGRIQIKVIMDAWNALWVEGKSDERP